jgi:hypothetical protein
MLYQNVFVAMAAAAVVLTAIHIPVWHSEYRAHCAWQATGFAADSDAARSYRRFHNIQTWFAVAIIVCMGVNILLGQIIVSGLIVAHLPDPALARYAIWTTGACFFIAYGTVNIYKRLMNRGCTTCSCRRKAK